MIDDKTELVIAIDKIARELMTEMVNKIENITPDAMTICPLIMSTVHAMTNIAFKIAVTHGGMAESEVVGRHLALLQQAYKERLAKAKKKETLND